MVKTRREDPALPVWVESGGVWHEGFVTGWVKGPGNAEWRASVTWSEPRDYGFAGRRVDVVDAVRLRPRDQPT